MALDALAGGIGSGAAGGTAVAPGWGTAIGAGLGALGSIAGGLISANAADEASARQAAALEAALAFQKQRYGEAQQNLNPFIQSGTQALGDYSNLVKGMTQPGYTYQQDPFSFDVNADPGAAYAMQQAQQAINASSIARGAVGGGAVKAMNTAIQDKGLEAFGGAYQRWLERSKLLQGQADNAYNRANEFQLNKIKATGGLAGAGQEAANTLANTGTQASTNVGNTLGSLGSARAGGAVGAGNALASGISGLASGLGAGAVQLQDRNDTNAWIQQMLKGGTSGGITAPEDFRNT